MLAGCGLIRVEIGPRSPGSASKPKPAASGTTAARSPSKSTSANNGKGTMKAKKVEARRPRSSLAAFLAKIRHDCDTKGGCPSSWDVLEVAGLDTKTTARDKGLHRVPNPDPQRYPGWSREHDSDKLASYAIDGARLWSWAGECEVAYEDAKRRYKALERTYRPQLDAARAEPNVYVATERLLALARKAQQEAGDLTRLGGGPAYDATHALVKAYRDRDLDGLLTRGYSVAQAHVEAYVRDNACDIKACPAVAHASRMIDRTTFCAVAAELGFGELPYLRSRGFFLGAVVRRPDFYGKNASARRDLLRAKADAIAARNKRALAVEDTPFEHYMVGVDVEDAEAPRMFHHDDYRVQSIGDRGLVLEARRSYQSNNGMCQKGAKLQWDSSSKNWEIIKKTYCGSRPSTIVVSVEGLFDELPPDLRVGDRIKFIGTVTKTRHKVVADNKKRYEKHTTLVVDGRIIYQIEREGRVVRRL